MRKLRKSDLPWATALLDEELGGRMQARRGALMDALEGSGLIASVDGRPVGLITWFIESGADGAEIRAVAVEPAFRRRGIGRALLDAAHASLRAAGAQSTWLVTTNDNVEAIRLYEGLGYRVTAVRDGAIDELRRTVKPSIPLVGEHGIPIRDELELAYRL